MQHGRNPPDAVPCRLCTAPVRRDAKFCPSCGVKEPWIPDEPAINPRIIRLAMWGGGFLLVGLLLVMFGVLMFSSAEEEPDHRPPGATSEAHEPR